MARGTSMPRRPSSLDRLASRVAVHPYLGFALVSVSLIATVVLVGALPSARLDAGVVGVVVTELLVLILGASVKEWNDALRLRQSVTNLEEIRRLQPDDFERLVMLAYRDQDYDVTRLGGEDRGDGGVDLVLQKAGRRTLVQCKNWRTWRVGVRVVREVAGIVVADGADRGVVVTSGFFSEPAKDFAKRAQIDLIDGDRLVSLLFGLQDQPADETSDRADAGDAGPRCRLCGGAMEWVRGYSSFWQCSNYPTCAGRTASRPADASRPQAAKKVASRPAPSGRSVGPGRP